MGEYPKKKIKCEIYRDSMQNYKKYAIPKAQLIIADVPYNVGTNFYGSNPMWYNGGGQCERREQICWKICIQQRFQLQSV
jgi:site-specific DNA-methyltransferase (adenine-specific)